jgi:hypothetical protein
VARLRERHGFGTREYHRRLTELEALLRRSADSFFAKDCRAKGKIRLKDGAQVMLLYNLDLSKGLANGSRGVVTGMVPVTAHLAALRQELALLEAQTPKRPRPPDNDDRAITPPPLPHSPVPGSPVPSVILLDTPPPKESDISSPLRPFRPPSRP